jgi:hypothetical protein
MFKSLKIAASAVVLAAGLTAASLVSAGTIVQCGDSSCTSDFSVRINGNQVGTGQFTYDAKTGEISLVSESNTWGDDLGNSLSVDSLSGNADPILIFGVGASTGVAGSTFGFTFNLPIALSGQINASSSTSYSLTSGSSAGAQIQGIGGNKVVTAYEVDTSVGGIGSINKGVDVGDTFFFLGGPAVNNSPIYTASNTFTGNLAYDLMTVKIDFSLSANSAVGISGFVEQSPVPVPAAVWLFGSGLIGLIGIARRKAS